MHSYVLQFFAFLNKVSHLFLVENPKISVTSLRACSVVSCQIPSCSIQRLSSTCKIALVSLQVKELDQKYL